MPPACRRRPGCGRCVRTPRSSCSSGAGSRATRRAASRSSSAAWWPAASRRSSPAARRSTAGAASTCALTTRRLAIDPPPARSSSSTSTPARGRPDRLRRAAVATGGEPIRPDLPGIDLPFIHGVQSLDDAQALLSLAETGCRRIVVVGGGYIGLEMAEAYIERGCTATVIERSAAATRRRRRRLRRRASPTPCARTASTSAAVSGSRASNPARSSTPDGPIGADLVVLGIGVEPRSELAAAAGIELGAKRRHPRRRASGDVGRRRLVGRRLRRRRRTWSPASRCTSPSARTPTSTAGWPASTWPAATPGRRGVLGTAITKLCALEIALTGPARSTRPRAGFDAVATTIDATTVAGYLPHATPMTIRMVAERGTGRVLGAQIIGGPGAAKRIDTIATAITAGMTVADVARPRPRLRPAVLLGLGSGRRRGPRGDQGRLTYAERTSPDPRQDDSSCRRSRTSFGAGSPSLHGSALSTRS